MLITFLIILMALSLVVAFCAIGIIKSTGHVKKLLIPFFAFAVATVCASILATMANPALFISLMVLFVTLLLISWRVYVVENNLD